MSSISLRLPNSLLEEIDEMAKELKVSRAEYIRRALESSNEEIHRRMLKARFFDASQKVRKDSVKINKEFAGIEHDPED